MCGEDGTQRVVYKLKEEHEKGDRNIRERKKHRLSKKNVKSKRTVSITRKEPIVVPALPSIYVRVNLFVPKKLI